MNQPRVGGFALGTGTDTLCYLFEPTYARAIRVINPKERGPGGPPPVPSSRQAGENTPGTNSSSWCADPTHHHHQSELWGKRGEEGERGGEEGGRGGKRGGRGEKRGEEGRRECVPLPCVCLW